MAGLPWPTSSYGLSSSPSASNKVKIYKISTGLSFGEFSSSLITWQHNRPNHVLNPIRDLGGHQLWRNPSGYSRHVWYKTVDSVGTHKVGTGLTYFAKDSPIWPGSAWNAILTANKNEMFSTEKPNVLSPYYTNAKAKAKTKALSDLASHKASMGENLAEMSKTIDSLADIARQVADVVKFYKDLRGARFGRISRLTARRLKELVKNGTIEKRLANAWLSYWYGFRPLYLDGKGLLELIPEYYNSPLLVHGRGRSMEQKLYPYVVDAPDTFFTPKLTVQDSSLLRVNCSLTGKVRAADGNILRTLNRAGLVNPVSLAWELVPFSFCVDWIIPVGETLDAFTAPIGLEFQGGSVTTSYQRTIRVNPHSSMIMSGGLAETSIRSFGFDREVLGSFPTPEFYEKTFFTGASRWATIAALISNLTRDIRYK